MISINLAHLKAMWNTDLAATSAKETATVFEYTFLMVHKGGGGDSAREACAGGRSSPINKYIKKTKVDIRIISWDREYMIKEKVKYVYK